MHEHPIDHILGALGKPDATAVTAGRAAQRQARTARGGCGHADRRAGPASWESQVGGRYRLQGEAVVPQTRSDTSGDRAR